MTRGRLSGTTGNASRRIEFQQRAGTASASPSEAFDGVRGFTRERPTQLKRGQWHDRDRSALLTHIRSRLLSNSETCVLRIALSGHSRCAGEAQRERGGQRAGALACVHAIRVGEPLIAPVRALDRMPGSCRGRRCRTGGYPEERPGAQWSGGDDDLRTEDDTSECAMHASGTDVARRTGATRTCSPTGGKPCRRSPISRHRPEPRGAWLLGFFPPSRSVAS
jgi:hypothetical protein